MLKNQIYYADNKILELVKSAFNLIEEDSWYYLYQSKTDNSFWRLDKWDKYQEQFFVKLDSRNQWTDFDDKELRIELLKNFRGISKKKCNWVNCSELALNKLVFCARHAYEELGIRK